MNIIKFGLLGPRMYILLSIFFLLLFPLQVFADLKINPVTGKLDRVSSNTEIQNTVGWEDDGTNIILKTSTDNVGIGVTSPTVKFEVGGAGNFTGTVTAGGFDQSLTGSNFKLDLYEGVSGVLTLKSIANANNEDMTIDLETNSNRVTFGSNTGVTFYEFPQTIKLNRIFVGGVDTGVTWNVSDGIVSYYKMEDAIGDNTVTDNQSLNSGVSVNAQTVDLNVQGKINYGFELTGASSEYIDLGSSSSLKLTSAISVAFWLKTTQSSTARLAGNRSSTGTNVGWEAILVSGQFRWFGDVGSTLAQSQSSTLINTGDWFFLVGTWDGTTLRNYVNGVLEDNDALSGDLGTGAGNTYIGRTPNTANYTSGTYDNFQIYNRELTLSEITDLFNLGSGTDDLAGGGTVLNTQVIGTSETVDSEHSLNSLSDLIVEGNIEAKTHLYSNGSIVHTDLSGSSVTFTECFTDDGVMACTIDSDGIADGS